MSERLVEVIKEGEIVKMPEWQAIDEDLFILRRPEVEEPVVSVKPEYREPTRERARPSISYSKNNVRSDLIDNFHWKISRVRREKNMSRTKLAALLGVKEEVVKELEFGKLPKDDFVLINKVQEVLGLMLRKDGKSFDVSPRAIAEKSAVESRKKQDDSKRNLTTRDVFAGNDIEIID